MVTLLSVKYHITTAPLRVNPDVSKYTENVAQEIFTQDSPTTIYGGCEKIQIKTE